MHPDNINALKASAEYFLVPLPLAISLASCALCDA
ncbi:hypothetical protein HP15_195 [Marinobacter adhaerens HP15]|uniref:Uncharacterized protein n=1 Tax=Marinobacter adhaerens (strain DSM 23420 / HP15) TaxID=225937 RepID=E4PK29_MARAH|nr:hypothetical protein HP15_195 [Marinobacter adhaerens HP15]